jgi:hypothetical protein
LIASGLFVFIGCTSIFQPPPTLLTADQPAAPGKKQIRIGQFMILTDADLNRDHPLFKSLEGLQEQVCKELRLPAATSPVYIFLFADRQRYDQYMHAYFNTLPARRAFFMARTDERRGDELVVYTYWGDRVQEDLRHELTHATLHSVLKDVPMWLDEGLAEYFEVPPEWQGVHYRHLAGLRTEPGVPWLPNLKRLEQLAQVKEMSPADYREAWAWVHLILHHSPETKATLLQYLQQLRTTKNPGPLEPQLAAVLPNLDSALRDHIAKLDAATRNMPAAVAKGTNDETR